METAPDPTESVPPELTWTLVALAPEESMSVPPLSIVPTMAPPDTTYRIPPLSTILAESVPLEMVALCPLLMVVMAILPSFS
jgi:hypothetical protein